MRLLVALGADHWGFPLKADLLSWLQDQGYQVLNLGAHSLDPSDDYPDFAEAVAQVVVSDEAQRGIVLCGSGVGASIAANKVNGARAGLCHDTYSARQGVEHDDMNILCLGTRVVGMDLAKELIIAFLHARFSGEERHCRRLQKVQAIEHKAVQGGS